MSRQGVIVSLTANALQFIAGADEIEDKYGQLEIKRNGSNVGIYRSGQWLHAARIADFPGGLTKDPETDIWVIETPEVSDGVSHPDQEP